MNKKQIWMFAVILILSSTTMLTSCSKDDEITVVNPQPKEYFTL